MKRDTILVNLRHRLRRLTSISSIMSARPSKPSQLQIRLTRHRHMPIQALNMLSSTHQLEMQDLELIISLCLMQDLLLNKRLTEIPEDIYRTATTKTMTGHHLFVVVVLASLKGLEEEVDKVWWCHTVLQEEGIKTRRERRKQITIIRSRKQILRRRWSMIQIGIMRQETIRTRRSIKMSSQELPTKLGDISKTISINKEIINMSQTPN